MMNTVKAVELHMKIHMSESSASMLGVNGMEMGLALLQIMQLLQAAVAVIVSALLAGGRIVHQDHNGHTQETGAV